MHRSDRAALRSSAGSFFQLLPRILTAVPTVSISTLASLPPTLRTRADTRLHDVARRRVDRDRPARAVRVLEFFRSSMVRSGSSLPFCSRIAT